MPRERHPKARQARSLARKRGKRQRYDRILIVCEGSKTEPLYLNDIRTQFRVPSAHIDVIHSTHGTEPRQVIDCSLEKFLSSRAYEWVFAVFDRDVHLTYNDALKRAEELDKAYRNDENKLTRFKAVVSVPCFEIWLLLHFQDVHAFWNHQSVIANVAQHLDGYQKGSLGIYAQTEDRIPAATGRAVQLRGHVDPATGTEPYTDMDRLVSRLRSLAGT